MNNSRCGSDIDRAVEVLRQGSLIGLPTETVYGLAADANRAEAVRKIFRVKGRPSDHPLIVHVDSLATARGWSAHWTESAELLASTYWPGPLTIIVKKAEQVIPEVTGGLDTVALRVPGHEMTLELLRRFGGGVAAPSANKFGKVSPTTARHVLDDLGEEVDYVLDGGPSRIGLESTIVDCSGASSMVLRPGFVSAESIRQTVGLSGQEAGSVRAPGMLPAHYAPDCEVTLVGSPMQAQELLGQADDGRKIRILDASVDGERFATEMYALLRNCDQDRIDQVIVVQPQPIGIGLAIRDRLAKAAFGSRTRFH